MNKENKGNSKVENVKNQTNRKPTPKDSSPGKGRNDVKDQARKS
jgi:hypothetical protein